MKSIFTVLTCLLLPASMLHAQNWWPDVTFPNNTGMCDGAQPKLVLYDDFSGSTLNSDSEKKFTKYLHFKNIFFILAFLFIHKAALATTKLLFIASIFLLAAANFLGASKALPASRALGHLIQQVADAPGCFFIALKRCPMKHIHSPLVSLSKWI